MVVLVSSVNAMTVMEKFYSLPFNPKYEQAVQEIVLPANSEDPVHVLDVPENCYAMVVLHWQDTKVHTLLGNTYNIIDKSQDTVNLVRVVNGHARKIGESGNVYAPAGPLIMLVKGGAANDVVGNVRIKVRILHPKEKQ